MLKRDEWQDEVIWILEHKYGFTWGEAVLVTDKYMDTDGYYEQGMSPEDAVEEDSYTWEYEDGEDFNG